MGNHDALVVDSLISASNWLFRHKQYRLSKYCIVGHGNDIKGIPLNMLQMVSNYLQHNEGIDLRMQGMSAFPLSDISEKQDTSAA